MVFKIVASCILFIAGWVFICKPSVIVHINRIARDVVFNDRLVLLKGRKIAVLFFCLAMVALYSGLNDLTRWIEGSIPSSHSTDYLMYMALHDYDRQKYPAAVERYQKVLQTDPMNTEAMQRLACTFTAMGDKTRAQAIWKKLARASGAEDDRRKQHEK